MVNRSQFVRKPKLQWSLLLTVLLGLCSLSAPHLLGHAHAHHNTAGRTSRSGSPSHRSRTGSSNADGDHDSEAASAHFAFDPHTPDHDAPHVAIVSSIRFAPVRWTALEAVVAQDEAPASLLGRSVSRGRAPPVA